VKNENIPVTPNPLPTSLIRRSKARVSLSGCDNPVVTCVLDWNRLKNPKNAIIAFQLLRRCLPEAELHLFGKGLAVREEGQLWCQSHLYDANVHFRGWIDNNELRDHLAHSMVLLHTSRTEACSVVVMEAMVIGVPVIGGRNSGGVPWQLGFGEAGLLVNINRPQAIARSLVTLMTQKELRERLIRRARDQAVRLFDPSSILEMWDSIYRRVANGQEQ
jgi:glycosyltransferase involved in cell wall biosynthesis